MNIKKGDTVKILAGKDRGKTGKVIHVFPEKKRVSVEGANVYKKHVRPKKEGEKGEMVKVTRPVNVSNVSVICPSCGKSARLGKKRKGKNTVRFCKKCNAPVE